MNCDFIAPFYWLMETAVFGKRLQQHRTAYLGAAANASRVLVLGDGDGRFTQALIQTYPDLEIDSIELSRGMLSQARKRVSSSSVHLMQGDALQYPFPDAYYDLVYTHFFLDCFDTLTLTKLIASIARASRPESTWIVSDFRQLHQGWRKIFSSFWLAIMYLFFRLATGLKTQRLPDHVFAMKANGFELHKQKLSWAGFIASEWWRRNVKAESSEARTQGCLA